MKKLVKLLALSLVLVFALSLGACGSSYGKVEKALLNNNFQVNTSLESKTNAIKSELEKKDLVIEIHGFYKEDSQSGGFSRVNVYVIEFKSTDDLASAIEKSATLKGILTDIASSEDAKALYNSLVEKGYANGNCLVFCTALGSEHRNEVKKIVKNA